MKATHDGSKGKHSVILADLIRHYGRPRTQIRPHGQRAHRPKPPTEIHPHNAPFEHGARQIERVKPD